MQVAYSYKQISEPVAEPVSQSLVNNHLAIDHTDNDALITAQITGARVMAEKHTGLIFGARSFRMSLSCWPGGQRIAFPVEPVASVTSFKYADVNGVQQTIDPANYRLWLDASPPILKLVSGYSYESLDSESPNPLTIEFVAGDDSNNAMVANAIMLICEYWRDNPTGAGDTSQGWHELPPGVVGVLDLLWTGGL